MDADSSDSLRDFSGCLLESGGCFFLALAPAHLPRDVLRWHELRPGLEVEVKYEGVWYQALIDESNVDCVEVKYVGFSKDEAYQEIWRKGNLPQEWKETIRAPTPHLHLYGLMSLNLRSHDITAWECRTFRNFGYVRPLLQAIEAIEEQLMAEESMPRVVASLANPSMRRRLEQPLAPLANLRRYGPHLPGAERDLDEHQRAAIEGIQQDLEAIQVRQNRLIVRC